MRNKKTFILSLFYILFVTSTFADGAGACLSYNAQYGKDKDAKNMTVSQFIANVLHDEPVPGIVEYENYPPSLYTNSDNKEVVASNRVNGLLDRLNFINRQPGDGFFLDGNQKPIDLTNSEKDLKSAEKVLSNHLSIETPDPGYDYIFLGQEFDKDTKKFTGKTLEVTRKLYGSNEKFIVFTARSGKKYVIASAKCGNYPPIRYMLTYGKRLTSVTEPLNESSGEEEAEQADNASNGDSNESGGDVTTTPGKKKKYSTPNTGGDVTINLTVEGSTITNYGAKIENSGNAGGGGNKNLTTRHFLDPDASSGGSSGGVYMSDAQFQQLLTACNGGRDKYLYAPCDDGRLRPCQPGRNYNDVYYYQNNRWQKGVATSGEVRKWIGTLGALAIGGVGLYGASQGWFQDKYITNIFNGVSSSGPPPVTADGSPEMGYGIPGEISGMASMDGGIH